MAEENEKEDGKSREHMGLSNDSTNSSGSCSSDCQFPSDSPETIENECNQFTFLVPSFPPPPSDTSVSKKALYLLVSQRNHEIGRGLFVITCRLLTHNAVGCGQQGIIVEHKKGPFNRENDVVTGRIFRDLQKIGKAEYHTLFNERRKNLQPQPLNTTTLMQLASEKLGLAPKKAMEIANKLFELKMISKPFTNSTAYSAGFPQKDYLKQIVTQLDEICAIRLNKQSLLGNFQQPLNNNKAVNNDNGEHNPPIHPKILQTGWGLTEASKLGESEKSLYELICRYFMATCQRACIYDKVTHSFRIGAEIFCAQTNNIISAGYTDILEWMKPSANRQVSDFKRGDLKNNHEFFVKDMKQERWRGGEGSSGLTISELIKLLDAHGINYMSIPEVVETLTRDKLITILPGNKVVPTAEGLQIVHCMNEGIVRPCGSVSTDTPKKSMDETTRKCPIGLLNPLERAKKTMNGISTPLTNNMTSESDHEVIFESSTERGSWLTGRTENQLKNSQLDVRRDDEECQSLRKRFTNVKNYTDDSTSVKRVRFRSPLNFQHRARRSQSLSRWTDRNEQDQDSRSTERCTNRRNSISPENRRTSLGNKRRTNTICTFNNGVVNGDEHRSRRMSSNDEHRSRPISRNIYTCSSMQMTPEQGRFVRREEKPIIYRTKPTFEHLSNQRQNNFRQNFHYPAGRYSKFVKHLPSDNDCEQERGFLNCHSGYSYDGELSKQNLRFSTLEGNDGCITLSPRHRNYPQKVVMSPKNVRQSCQQQGTTRYISPLDNAKLIPHNQRLTTARGPYRLSNESTFTGCACCSATKKHYAQPLVKQCNNVSPPLVRSDRGRLMSYVEDDEYDGCGGSVPIMAKFQRRPFQSAGHRNRMFFR